MLIVEETVMLVIAITQCICLFGKAILLHLNGTTLSECKESIKLLEKCKSITVLGVQHGLASLEYRSDRIENY